MLGPAEITRDHEDGYVVSDFRVPAETLEAIKAMHTELLAQQPEFRNYYTALLDHDRGFLRFAQDGSILAAKTVGNNV